ncbi:MAG: hypothetical protein COV36_00930 [Alphaproteobacteria bacterium CG11_big_fil_rev_8_21_14_0_20_44_7]|nr:MAG: hypothetical protein COV36_00930 [Alphaproteobacteria bacterium CG11_big_fil_rev_8_21_14_0_20_44_7]
MKKGFTLVELSIVLVIIGLLIGGVLVAQSMISSSKVQGVMKEYGQYEAAIRLFHATYKAMPGDSTRVAAMLGVGAGNNDGRLSTNAEQYSAWNQLTAAGLVLKNADTASGDYSNSWGSGAEMGVNIPKSKVYDDAGWAFYGLIGWNMYNAGNWENVGRNQIRLAARRPGSDGNTHTQNWVGPLYPQEALSIDTKMDDSLPGTGDVGHMRNGAGTSNSECATTTNNLTAEYDLTMTTDDCHIVFWLPDL